MSTISEDIQSAMNQLETPEEKQTLPVETPEAPVTDPNLETPAETVEEIFEPLSVWPEEIKQRFSNLGKLQGGKTWQKFLIEREKERDADYTRKQQARAEFLKTYEPVDQVLAPYREELKRSNLDAAGLLRRYINTELMLRENPREALRMIAETYGVDINQPNPDQDDPILNHPAVGQLRQEIMTLKGHLTEREQREQQAQTQTRLTEIESFSEEKNNNGELTHPFFHDVMDDMVLLAQAERAAGRVPKLQDLYDRAVWANPTTRQKSLAAQSAEQQRKSAEEAAQKAAQARKASAGVSGSPGSSAPRTDRSLREELEAAFGR